jgi:rhodanese-related sulfurtransferase
MPQPPPKFPTKLSSNRGVRLDCSVFVWVSCLIGACGLGLAGCSSSQQIFEQSRIADDKVRNVSVAELSQLYERSAQEQNLLILIDPRSKKAFEAGHIPGAKHLTLPQVPPNAARDPEIERHANIVVYGNNPATPTAIAMTKRLLAAKYENVRFYAGGLSEWRLRGFAVEEPPASKIEGEARPGAAAPDR